MSSGMKCDNCQKGVMYGHNVSHAKNRTRKIFKPNLHRAKIIVSGVRKTLKLCTKCLRMLKKTPQPFSKQPARLRQGFGGPTAEQAI